jgi:hypothetical protein
LFDLEEVFFFAYPKRVCQRKRPLQSQTNLKKSQTSLVSKEVKNKKRVERAERSTREIAG